MGKQVHGRHGSPPNWLERFAILVRRVALAEFGDGPYGAENRATNFRVGQVATLSQHDQVHALAPQNRLDRRSEVVGMIGMAQPGTQSP